MSFLKQGQGLAKHRLTPAPSPASGDNLLIIVEGEVTETVYFALVRRRLELSSAQFEIVPHGSNNPRDLVDKALEEKKRREKDSKKREGLLTPIAYNQLWIVFDTDAAAAQGHLAPGITYAATSGVRVASSTPSFEYWLALHLDSAAPLLPTAGHAETHLNGLLRPHGKTYTKRQAKLAADALMPWFVGDKEQGFTPRVPDALRHSRQVRGNRIQSANTACSDVDWLFDELLAAALPHHRKDFEPPVNRTTTGPRR